MMNSVTNAAASTYSGNTSVRLISRASFIIFVGLWLTMQNATAALLDWSAVGEIIAVPEGFSYGPFGDGDIVRMSVLIDDDATPYLVTAFTHRYSSDQFRLQIGEHQFGPSDGQAELIVDGPDKFQFSIYLKPNLPIPDFDIIQVAFAFLGDEDPNNLGVPTAIPLGVPDPFGGIFQAPGWFPEGNFFMFDRSFSVTVVPIPGMLIPLIACIAFATRRLAKYTSKLSLDELKVAP